MALTKKEEARLKELSKKYTSFQEEAVKGGASKEEAKAAALLKLKDEAEEFTSLTETRALEEEEPEEEEPEFPAKIKINEKVQVYDESRGRWYDAQWNIFGAGEDIEYAPISIAAAGTYSIVGGIQGRKIIITSISFTVDGACNITLSSSFGNISGAMPFGDTGQPMGMAAGTGAYFIPLQEGAGFNITVSANVNVGGFVTYVRR